jgi:gliding motility-associated-like protein
MNRFYISVFLLFIMQVAASQQPVLEWVKGLQRNNFNNYTTYNNGRSVGVDGQGNVYSTGLFEHTIDMDPGAGVYNITGGGFDEYGIYISKLDANGNFVWGKQIPVLVEWAPIELKVDKNGNIYLTANFNQQADMDPGPGVYMMKPIGPKDAFVVKLDTDGNLVWAKQFGGPGDTVPESSALDLDKDGNVIVCGIFNNTVDFDSGPGTYNLTSTAHLQCFIVKLNNNGDFIWALQFGNSPVVYGNSYITDVRCDSKGNICLTGDFARTCDFDPGPSVYNMTSSPGCLQDSYLAKLDGNGNFIWAKQLVNSTGAYNDFMTSRGIDVDGMNNIVITGAAMATRDFDPGPGVYTPPVLGNYDCFILKLNEQGEFVWAKRIGSKDADEGNDVAVDSDNNVYVIGSFGNGSDLDPGTGVYTLNGGIYGTSALIKLNPGGDFVYAAPCDAFLRRMDIDASRNIYITGAFGGVVDFDPGPKEYFYTGDGETPYVYKLAPCAHITTSILDVTACDSYTLNSVQFNSTGTYTQVIPNSVGCDSVIRLNLTITKKFTEQTKTICEGDFFYAGGANQSKAGTYRDTLKTWQGCDSTVTTTLIVNPVPVPDLGPDRDLCSNTQLDITPGSFTSYIWQDMSATKNFKISSAGKYWVRVTNSFNCTATDTLVIRTMLPIPSNFLRDRDSICSYESIQVMPVTFFASYQWSTGESEQKLLVQKSGSYWLAVTDAKGCTGVDTITVFQKQCMKGCYVPTAFSPNHDGKNDLFRPMLFGPVKKYHFIIYSRWGQVLFETVELNKAWDGTVAGTLQQSNVFTWMCTYQFEGEEVKTEKGTVMLVR